MRALDDALTAVTSLSGDASSAVDAGLLTSTEALQAQVKLRELRSKQVRLRSGIRLEASFSGIPRFPSADVNFFPHGGAADAQRATHHAGHSPHSLICLILILRLQYLRGLYIMDFHSQ
jgi:hypothetical protein